MPPSKPLILDLEHISYDNAELYLYPEFLEERGRFEKSAPIRVLDESSRHAKVMKPTRGGDNYITKMERPEGHVHRVKNKDVWLPIEKEVAIARALSKLVKTEYDDMKFEFEEPYGILITENEKYGLFKVHADKQKELGITELDNIKKRIIVKEHFHLNEGKIEYGLTTAVYENDTVDVEDIVRRIEGLYNPEKIGHIILAMNGIDHPDYKSHSFSNNGTPSGLFSDFEMLYILDENTINSRIKNIWTYTTEKITAHDKISFQELLERYPTIESMVQQKEGGFEDRLKSSEELVRLRKRREEISNRISEYTGMSSPEDTRQITPGPAFGIIQHIRNAEPKELL